jgi:hypothetical protein
VTASEPRLVVWRCALVAQGAAPDIYRGVLCR